MPYVFRDVRLELWMTNISFLLLYISVFNENYKGFQKIVCILHVLRFPGSAEKPLIAARFGCLQCSEISGSAK